MSSRPCLICHGEKQVNYGIFSERLPHPEPCRCCDGTGRQLWEEADPAFLATLRRGAEQSYKERTRRKQIWAKTYLAITTATYDDYRRECVAAGYTPCKPASWGRTRYNHKTHPDFVPGRMGPPR